MPEIKTKIVQITPRLPPHRDGVGDYSLHLAEQLLKTHGITTEFLTFQPGIKIPPVVKGFPTTGFPTRTRNALVSFLPKDIETILLQYSNYPYTKGKIKAPFWLADALQLALSQRRLKLIVMFHELPMLKFKRFNVLSPIQSIVSYRLAKMATAVVTDSARFQAVLSQWRKQPVPCIPDFSTIGEPESEEVLPLEKRDRRLVIFGSNDRRRVYQYFLPELLKTCQHLGIEEICDVGRPLHLNSSDFPGIRLVEMGLQPDEAVREVMLNARAGFLDYSRFPGDLGKSSVFAAFCAHGLVPISSRYNPSEADGLEMNRHYLVPSDDLKHLDFTQLQTISDNVRRWYCDHNLESNANLFASKILG